MQKEGEKMEKKKTQKQAPITEEQWKEIVEAAMSKGCSCPTCQLVRKIQLALLYPNTTHN
jgi:hypothetical protein